MLITSIKSVINKSGRVLGEMHADERTLFGFVVRLDLSDDIVSQ